MLVILAYGLMSTALLVTFIQLFLSYEPWVFLKKRLAFLAGLGAFLLTLIVVFG